jgi:UDP-GlcNAc:undecaprenyl-phosphate/decaprenyl-phosphate GlcNAc-1-phosphate transferase
MRTLFAIAAVLFVTMAMVPLLRRIAPAIGLVDHPDARKHHAVPTPLVGGLAIFIALASVGIPALLATGAVPRPAVLSLLGGGLLMVITGLIDDRQDLSPAARFVAQAGAALLMIFGGGVLLADLGGMTPSGEPLPLGWLALPFTVFATLGVINALNMCDGLDGLSGILALVSLLGLLAAAGLWGTPGNVLMLGMVAAGVIGFLFYNLRLPGRSRAWVFLGDAGSMFLGFALTWFTVSLSQGEQRVIPPAAALWFLMVPIIDAVSMMLRRVVRGRSPFAPDREHLHHVFLLAGFSVNQTVGIMAGLAAAGVAVGLAATWWQWPELPVAIGFLAVGLGYFWMIMHAWRVMRFLHRSICRRQTMADRRRGPDPAYRGPERRSGRDRRVRAIASAAVTSAPPKFDPGMARTPQ